MPKTWSELSQLPEFQDLSREQQEQARQVYFQKYVAPGVAPEQQEQAKSLFDRKTLNRTWGEAATDTGKQLLEGGVNIVNAIPSLIAPDWAGTKALDSVAQDIQDWQSPVMKTKIANANAAIDKAGAEGLTAQAGEALSQYWDDPALASRLVATNLASLIPGLGSAKIAQATSLARSAKAAGVAADALGAAEKAKAAKMALIAGGVTNSALNAGGARGEAYKDLYNTARQQDYSPEEANQIALDKSLLPAGIGALTGAASGVMGLESGLFGKVAGKSALASGAKHFGTEITGELGEEALPQLATNWQASEYDQRPLTKDIGRTLVETALATGPNATVAGISGSLRNEAPVDPNAPPVVDPNAPPVVDPNAPPVVDPNAPPVVDPNASPVVDPNASPVVDPNASPVVDPNASPVVDPNASPVVDPNASPVVDPNASPVVDPIPVVGPLSAAAQAGQEASLAGAPTLPLPSAPDPVLAQQESDNAAIQQQQAAAKQQQADQLAALKIKQEQLKVNQAEQKLGLGPTQFDEPNLLAQAQGLAAMSQPTVDQTTPQETTNGLQTEGQAPDAAPAAVVTPAGDTSPAVGQTAIVPDTGMRVVHGSGNPSLTLNDIEIIRTTGQKQGKKGRVYGGLYGTSETDAHQAEGYAKMMGGQATLYDINIKPGTKILHKEGDITRLSKPYIEGLVSQGYGVVIGQDPRGRTEYAVIDKGAIHSLTPRGNPSPASFAPNPENPNRDQASVEAYNSFVEDYHLRHDEAQPRDKLRIATEADMPASSRVGRRLAGAVAAAFGHRVVFVAPQDPTKTLTIDGSISPHDPTTIFLAHDSAKPFTRVAVHEMVHGMRRVAPSVYTDMTKALRQIYDPAKVAEHVAWHGYRGGLTDANEEEWVSNFVSDSFHRPEVLARLARAMDMNKTGAGLEFLKRTQEFFTRIKAKLMGDPAIGRDLGAEAAIKELDAAHDHVVKALAQYARLRMSNVRVQDMAPLSPMPAARRPVNTESLTGMSPEQISELTPTQLRSITAEMYKSVPTEQRKAITQAKRRAAVIARKKAKNPPIEKANTVTDIYSRKTVSTRSPTARDAKEDPVTQNLGLDLKTYLKSPALLPKVVEVLATYPQLRTAKPEATDEQRLRSFIGVIRDNLLWLHDKVKADIRARSKLWYDGALKITERAAARYQVTERQFAAVLATQSPQKDWFENVSLAERITAIFKLYQSHTWDAKMDSAANRVLKQEELAELAEDLNADEVESGDTASKFIRSKARGIVRNSNGTLSIERATEIAKAEQSAKNAANQARLDRVRGKRLDEIYNDLDAAVWVRVFDAAHHSPHYNVVSPEGNFVGIRQAANGPARIRWGTFAAVAKSISVLNDGSIENISAQLGKEHKIRNFYNNIIAPNDPRGYVTMDTHAIAADMVSPFSGNSTPVSHNFGSKGAPGSTVYGISGTYAVHGAGYTQAANKAGLLPREMQSITWEAIRGMFPAQFKRKENIDHINALWQAYHDRKATLEATREAILAYVMEKTGRTEEQIFTPEWARSPTKKLSDVSYEALPGLPTPSPARHSAGSGMNAEVAPNPDLLKGAAKGAAAKWELLSAEERSKVTTVVGGPVIKQIMAKLGIDQYRMEFTVGGYEDTANPSITIHFGPQVSWNQLEEATRVVGYVWKQKEMVMFDETDTTGNGQTSYIRVDPTRKLSAEELSDLYIQVHAAFPDAGGMSVSDGAPVFANFSDLSDTDFQTGIESALNSYLTDKDYKVNVIAYEFRSALIGDVVGQDKAGNDIIQTTLRGTRYDDVTKTTGTGGKDGWRTIGKTSWAGGEALRWQGDYNEIQADFDRRFTREVGYAHKRSQLAAAPASLRPDAASDGRAGAQGRPSYGQAQKGSVQGTGVHYSRAERSSLDSSKYGTGMRGQEAARIAQASDPRLKQRVYFYINNGTGIRPETGVGGYTHTVELRNLYDLDADPLYLTQKAADVNGFESAVLDAGFDGYVADAGGQRAAVLMGPHQVPVRYEGTAKRPDVAPGRRATPNPIKQVAAIIGAPWQRRTPAAFGAILKAKNPDLYAQFADQFAATDKAYWPDEMARSLRPPDTTNATQADVAMWSRPMPASLRTKPAPKKTVKAYKLFRLDPKRPGELFPLFVKLGENRNVPMGVWEDAEAGAAASQPGKVRSTIGQLAYRPGWHAGDLPIATHIGGDRDPNTSKPTSRRPDQVWAEVELAADRDWQTEATSRSRQVKHQAITDQVPVDGYYRYKTNPNMTGNWLIGGSMKVNRLLSDAEVKRINDEAGTADLPRREPLDLTKFGFSTPIPASLRLENPKVIYTAAARSEGSDLDRAIVNARLDEAEEAAGKPVGVDSLKPGDPINTTKQGIANALEKGRGGSDVYGNYAYPIFETEAAALQRNQFRPFYADGQWWMDAVTVINGAYAGNTNNRGGINTEAQKDFRTIDRRTADVWEVPHMPYPNTAKDYPMPASLRTWFGKSQITTPEGDPKIMYHWTTEDITSFRGEQAGAIFLTDNPAFASGFAGSEEGANVLPVYVSASNVFDYRDPKHIARLEGVLRQNHGEAPIEVAMPRVPVMRLPAAELAKRTATGNWMFVESPPVMAYIRANHDGFWSKERNQVNLGVFKPNQIKSAVGNVGTFDPKTDDIRFSNRPMPPEETRFRKAQRIVQDKFNRFRVVQDWLKEQGVRLSEGADVYKAEERFHARVANQIEDFREQTLKPLVEKTQKAKVSMEDVAQFLHAQHAKERNEAIAKINPNFPDGGSGMATQVALDILNQASPELKAIANEWRAIADDSLQMKVDSGLITPEMADAFRNKYRHYVPLKGGPDEQRMVGTGKGLKVRHKEKRALGHPLRDGGEWIVEQLLADREATVMKAEKALLAKHVLQMAVEMQRPDIISVEQPKLRQVLKQKNAYVVTYKGSPVNSFQSLEAARVFRQMAGTMKGHHIIDFDIVKSSDPQVVLMASPMLADNETMAYLGGHEIRMQINDDLLARAYGNLGQEALGPILRAGRALNTYLSKAYTGYNPEFILTNMIRDFTTGIANLTGEQGLRIAGKAVKHYPKAFMDLLRSTRGPGHVSQAIMDYREDGGNTGAAYLDDLERIGTNVQAEYAKLQGVVGNFRSGNISGAASAAIGKTLKPLIGWIEKLNQASENAMRLAIYQAMREAGKGRVQAASAAKNTTVNFNRKGEMGMAINAWWLFFNAAVQGTSAIAHAHFKGANKGQAWALSSSLIGTAYLASLAAAAGGDDDEDRYEKLSDYERSRNLIIKAENGYVKIPIPYGYGFFWNLGRTLADTQRTGKLGTAPWGLASNFLEEFTPFGSMVTGAQPDSKQAMMFMGPTAWQAFAVPAFNLTSFGSPLYPERSFQTAEFARDQMWRGTKGTWADELAGALEQAGLDVSPETLKHLWRTGTGGAGTFATSLFDLGQMSARGVGDFDAREIPFVRKVWTVPGVREARARYYQAVTEAETAKETFKRYKKKGDFEKAATYQGENQALISLADLASSTAKRIKAARDRYDAIKLDDELTLPEKRRQMRELEVEETQIYDGYMRTFDERTRRVPN